MIHPKNNLKTNHTYKLINLSNQPAQFNQQEGTIIYLPLLKCG